MFQRTWLVVVALLFSVTTAVGQGFPDPDREPSGNKSDGNTKIPITSGASEVLGAETTGSSSSPSPIPLEQPVDPKLYVCGPGDVFELNFWGQQNFRLRISADVEGRTFISKVGFVDVAGKTLADVRTQVKKKVRQSYPGLQVDLVLAAPRRFLVHVVNFVKAPGSYEVHALERVATVLNRAGGITGSQRRISIKHRDGSEVLADLQLYEFTGDTKLNPTLLDGDVITVPAPKLVATISGAVRRPGRYELINTNDVKELIDLAGGLTSSVALTLPVRITRRNQQQHATFIDLAFKGSGAPNYLLVDEDVVSIPSVTELQRTVLLVGAVTAADAIDTATTLKRLPYVEGDTVRSLIERAGGIRTAGDLSRSYISRGNAKEAPTLIPIDLDALLVRRDFSADKAIQMNDVLVVPPMQFGVLVEGAVAKTGLLEYNPRFGISEYIARAGGRTRVAQDIEDVRLIDPEGRVHKYGKNVKVNPGDSILVPERNFTRAEVAQLTLAIAGLLISGVAVTIAATR
jgi:polysaccharide biosynthesis/export protein